MCRLGLARNDLLRMAAVEMCFSYLPAYVFSDCALKAAVDGDVVTGFVVALIVAYAAGRGQKCRDNYERKKIGFERKSNFEMSLRQPKNLVFWKLLEAEANAREKTWS